MSACVYGLCTNGQWSEYRVQCKTDVEMGSYCVKVPGECCPVCFTSDSVVTALAAIANQANSVECQVSGGRLFHDGELWRPGDCLVCKCFKGAVVCVQPQCSEMGCAFPMKVKGECCPVCSDKLDSTTDRVTCRYRGSEYLAGSSWTLNCQTCHCGEDGRHSCSFVECPALNCSRTVRLRARATCCPVCLGMFCLCLACVSE